VLRPVPSLAGKHSAALGSFAGLLASLERRVFALEGLPARRDGELTGEGALPARIRAHRPLKKAAGKGTDWLV